MENQQSFFIDPREQTQERENVRETEPIAKIMVRDPRARGPWWMAERREYQVGYEGPYEGPAYKQTLGEKVLPRRMRRRMLSWPLIIIIAICILAFSGFMTARYDQPWSHGYHERSVFEVADDATLIVNDNSGRVYIHTGDYHHISITKVIRSSGSSGQHLPATDERLVNSRTVAVDVNDPQAGGRDTPIAVDLDITVPETANLVIHASREVVSIEDVKGKIQVDTTHGNIELDSTEGQVTLTTSDGNIELSDAQLSGSSALKTSSGNIDLAGSLDPYGNYAFETGSGSTDITLPGSSTFHLNTPADDAIENDFHSTSVGDGQQAGVTIRTSSGHIAVHQED